MQQNTHRPRNVRTRLFTVGALLLPVLFFALIEGTLRLAGFGNDYPLFVDVPGHPAYRAPNPDVGRRYFARSSVVPAPPQDAFLREKPPGTFRIFVQGASTAAGFPYGHGGTFARMLHQRLIQTFPDRNLEVVNTAMAAVNSYTLLDFADEIAAQQPDAVLIYAGHNEYYGALGVGSTESFGPMRTLVRLYLALDHLRLVQGLRALWVNLASAGAAPATERAEGATLMEDMARERSIPLGTPLYRRGLDQFRANLTALLCRYERAGIPVFVGTLASNERDQAPFVSGLAPGTDAARWQAEYDASHRLAAAGDTSEALAALDALLRLDDTSAQAYYARARLREAAGLYAEARADYLAAKDRDQLRFRAPEAMNAAVREASAACGATVVDTQSALADASPGGIIGADLILEHLHPNVDGYFLLADAFYEALRASGLIGPWDTPVPAQLARREVLVTALDSALAALHVRRLRNNWPFQPPGVTRPDTIRVATPVDALALEVLQGRRSWLEATAALGARYEAEGDLTAALRVALALIREQPYLARPYLLAGNLMVKQQRYATAFRYFQAADAREPSAEARRMMGHVLIRSGRTAEAVPYLQQALRLAPDDQAALYDLGVAYVTGNRPADARATAERLLRLNPEHPGGLRLMAHLAPR